MMSSAQIQLTCYSPLHWTLSSALKCEFFRCYGWTICIFIQVHKAVNFALNLDLMRKGRGQSWWPLQPGICQLPIFGSSTSLLLLIWLISYFVERGGGSLQTWTFFCSLCLKLLWSMEERYGDKGGFPAHLKPIYTPGRDSSFFIEAHSFPLLKGVLFVWYISYPIVCGTILI